MKPITAVLLFLLSVCAFAADVTGKWTATVQGPDGDMQLVFNLKQEGATVTGTVEGPMGEMPVSEGKMEGDTISFTVAADQFKVVHKGTVTGDEMKLKVDMGERNFDMIAHRAKS